MPLVTIDLRLIDASGIGTYLSNVVPKIVQNSPNIEFHLIGPIGRLNSLPWASLPNVTVDECSAPIYSLREQLEILEHVPVETDLFWFPHFNIPVLYQGRLLVTIYDAFHLAFPRLVGGPHKRLYARLLFFAARLKAAAILTISEFSRQELLRLTSPNRQRIHAIPLGVDLSDFAVSEGGSPHSRPFLLFVGNVKPHKNLVTLVRAFCSIANRIPHDLVIVGKKEGFLTGDKEVFKVAKLLGDRIHFTGKVDQYLMKRYLSKAEALVFPSLYEGFGLPPLEAMAAGCPVIVSNAASLPEVCADAAVYFDPQSPEDLADKIMTLVNDPDLVDSLRKRGRTRAQQMSWQRCVDATQSVLLSLLDES